MMEGFLNFISNRGLIKRAAVRREMKKRYRCANIGHRMRSDPAGIGA
ncbi:hypothetical protein [Ralstonia solanacearum]|nr:hypothetical protein [Ralstonia solanacearum]